MDILNFFSPSQTKLLIFLSMCYVAINILCFLLVNGFRSRFIWKDFSLFIMKTILWLPSRRDGDKKRNEPYNKGEQNNTK